MEDTRPLWWLYYSKKHLEPQADFLKSPDLNEATDDERISILSVMSQMEVARKKAQGETRLAKPRRSFVLLIMLLLIVAPNSVVKYFVY